MVRKLVLNSIDFGKKIVGAFNEGWEKGRDVPKVLVGN